MALPEKEHFTLAEIATRWNTTYDALVYYVEHEHLEVQAWLPQMKAEVYFWEETPEGESFSCPCGTKCHQGYAIISAADCRKIFKNQGSSLREFKLPQNEMYIRCSNSKKGCRLVEADLRVTRIERDRFEQQYEVHPVPSCVSPSTYSVSPAKKPSKKEFSPSFPGRPSIMSAIRIELRKRADAGELHPTLSKECAYLAEWAFKKFHGVQVPKQCSIENALRADYRACATLF